MKHSAYAKLRLCIRRSRMFFLGNLRKREVMAMEVVSPDLLDMGMTRSDQLDIHRDHPSVFI